MDTMKWKLLFSIFAHLLMNPAAGQVTFPANLYFNSTVTVKDGLIEAGISYPQKKIAQLNSGVLFTSFIRLPLTDKDKQVVTLDRNTQQWRFINVVEWTKDNTAVTGPINFNRHNLQLEWGYGNYAYYPTGKKSEKSTHALNSFGVEWKSSFYKTEGAFAAPQHNFQFRLRYSSDAKEGDKVGIVQPPNNLGVVITKDLIIEAARIEPKFMPAILFQQYRGTGKLTFAEAFYYDFYGKKDVYNPFNNVERGRFEFWIFFYPNVAKQPNVKLGFAPFFSARTKGEDDEKKFIYGAQLSFKVGGSFLRFF
jgi:hypothetical protein